MIAKKLYWADENMGPVRIDDWPEPPRPNITICWHHFNYVGTITIQGSFFNEPDEDDWFEISSETYEVLPNTGSLHLSGFTNIKARIIWLKVTAETESGRIDSILVI